MRITIRSTRPEDNGDLRSLFYALNNVQYLRDNALFELGEAQREDMSAELAVAVIDVVLSTGFNLASLALTLTEWRKGPGRMTSIDIESPVRTTRLPPAETTNADDEDLVLRRALVGASDPTQSNCVLIGVNDYGRLPTVPGVQENLEEVRAVLTDRAVWGVPGHRVRTVSYPRNPDSILNAISDAARDASDTLLVYFVGHGIHDGDRGLALALKDAPRDGRPLDHQVVRWKGLADVVGNATARRCVIWLDCCYSGLALADTGAPGGPPELLDVADVAGTYVFAATQSAAPAKSSGPGQCTAFTRELVRALREGAEPGPPKEEFLSLNRLHREVRTALEVQELPVPGWHDPGHIGHLPHFRNAKPEDKGKETKGSQDGDPTPVRHKRERTDTPPRPWQDRRVQGIGVAVLVVLVLLFGWWWIPGPFVSGLSLTGYCSGLAPGGPQRFRIAGDDCVQEVDLDAACVYQYRQPDLKARFTTPDANSAVCDNPSTGFTYEAGISDMRGYCATRTTVPTVEATAENARYDNTWVCQVPINTDLACNSQNNRTDLASREEDDGRWSCHRAHLF